jgi:hypothetical protein
MMGKTFKRFISKYKVSVCLTKHRATNTYDGAEVQLHVFLTYELSGMKVIKLTRLSLSTPGERGGAQNQSDR